MLIDEKSKALSISEQCRILGLPRSVYYRKRSCPPRDPSVDNPRKKEHEMLCDVLMKEWLDHPTYGYIKMSKHLLREGYDWATEYRIRTMYNELGLKGQAPLFKSTRPSKGKPGKHPYLLRDRTIRYVNEVWATDITYIKIGREMVFFTAIIDIFSRKILSWRLSRSMDVGFCLDALLEAIERFGVPAIFNTDCGSQYTSREFTSLLEEHGIRISMDGIGRCKDNIYVERTWRTLKYEWIFLREYESLEQLENSLGSFVEFFNNERIHQALGYKTPEEVYKEGSFPNVKEDTKVA